MVKNKPMPDVFYIYDAYYDNDQGISCYMLAETLDHIPLNIEIVGVYGRVRTAKMVVTRELVATRTEGVEG